MRAKNPTVALLTDFGSVDHYAGVVKGVLRSACPGISIIDISHEVPPHSILNAAYLLWSSYRFMPAGTVFLTVVDPGVGTQRDIILVRTSRYNFIAPDNGVLDLVLWEEKRRAIVMLDVGRTSVQNLLPRNISSTFHGRDVFAPIAARIAAGSPIERFGSKIPERAVLPPFVTTNETARKVRVLHVDRYGNIITNIVPDVSGAARFPRGMVVGRKKITQWIRNYAEAPKGRPCLIVGSSGLLEVVVNRGSASHLLFQSKHAELELL